MARIVQFLRNLFRHSRIEADIDEEIRSSFEMIVQKFLTGGMSLPDALRATRLEFEGVEQVKEKVRDGVAGAYLFTFLRDVGYAWRGLRKHPSFALISLITLTLGIGVNTAVFSVFYAMLMRPLPYSHPQELAVIWANFRTRGNANVSVSGEILREIEQRQRAMVSIGGIWVTPPRTFPGDPPEQIKSAFVTSNFFDVLGIQAVLGRAFAKEDAGGPTFLLSEAFFRRRFASDPNLIGKAIRGPGGVSTPIGVLPVDFQLHFAPEANVPADVELFQTWGPGFYGGKTYIVRLIGRLRPGISMANAQEDLNRVATEIRGSHAEFASEDLHLSITGMQKDAFRDVQPALTALFVGGAAVLFICGVNVTGLLLARAADRRKEIALRLALGASRGRILGQLLTEGALISVIGGIAGVGTGWAVFRGLLAFRPERLDRISESGMMWPAIAFAAAASLGATIVFGVAPAFLSFEKDQLETLRSRGRGWMDRLHRRVGRILVVSEITLGFVLVTGAVLTTRTLSQMGQVRPGFEPRQLLAFQMPGLPPGVLSEWEERFGAVPGVESAGAISHLPLDNTLPNWYGGYRIPGMPENQASIFTSDNRAVTPSYFQTMEVRLKEGRFFDSRDRAGAQNVVIVDELLARDTWPGQSAIGKSIGAEHMTANGLEPVTSVVVGVVEHVLNHSITKKVRGEIYSPFSQNLRGGYPQTFVLRTRVPPLSLVAAIRSALRERSPTLAIDKVLPMTEYVHREIAPAEFTAVLAAIFGVLALVLAATGIYGVLDYQVSRRLPEMGVRMALGASTRQVVGLVLREGLVLATLGVLLGIAAAPVAASGLSAVLYGVSVRDPLSYALSLMLLPAATLLGCWRPARRAAGANPVDAIREE